MPRRASADCASYRDAWTNVQVFTVTAHTRHESRDGAGMRVVADARYRLVNEPLVVIAFPGQGNRDRAIFIEALLTFPCVGTASDSVRDGRVRRERRSGNPWDGHTTDEKYRRLRCLRTHTGRWWMRL